MNENTAARLKELRARVENLEASMAKRAADHLYTYGLRHAPARGEIPSDAYIAAGGWAAARTMESLIDAALQEEAQKVERLQVEPL